MRDTDKLPTLATVGSSVNSLTRLPRGTSGSLKSPRSGSEGRDSLAGSFQGRFASFQAIAPPVT